MERLLIEHGRIIDPSQRMDKIGDLLIVDGRIAAINPDLKTLSPDVRHLDATGKIVSPGLIDMHVHLREPDDNEESETIETGTMAAISGGFTSVACCPNTRPPLDTQANLELVRQLALRADHCNVFPMCCISKNREGKELAELGILFESGAVACSDDGSPIDDAELMRRAMEYCLMFDKPILSHTESFPLD